MTTPTVQALPGPLTLNAPWRTQIARIGAGIPWAAPMTWIAAGMAALIGVQWGALAVAAAGFDPISSTVSDLFYAPGGAWLMSISGGLTLVGGVILARRVTRSGAQAAGWALMAWCVALALATVFPTDPPGMGSLSLTAQVHRWAAAAMFVATPLAGYLAAKNAAPRAAELLRSRSGWCAAAGVAQLVFSAQSLLPAEMPPLVALFEIRGLAERVLFVTMIAVMVSLARIVGDRCPRAEGTSPRAGHALP